MESKVFEAKCHKILSNNALSDREKQKRLEALFNAKRIADKANAQGHQLTAQFPVQSSGKLRHDRLLEHGHFDYFRVDEKIVPSTTIVTHEAKWSKASKPEKVLCVKRKQGKHIVSQKSVTHGKADEVRQKWAGVSKKK